MRILTTLLLLLSARAWAAPYPLTLAEEDALAASSALQALAAEARAGAERERAAWSALWPRLGLDGSLRYNTEIPSVKLSPAAPALPFGDHLNYSAGLNASWTLFDGLQGFHTLRAAQAASHAKREELEARRRELRLRLRLAYFQAGLAAERARLLADSVELARSQAGDIELRLKEGASSRIDFLSARNEVLLRRGQERQARADLSAALRDLSSLSGREGDMALEPQEESLARLKPAGARDFPSDLPAPKSLQLAAEAAREQARAAGSGHWPRLQAGARASLDYPNGPVLERVQQNSVSLAASWPLFAFGQVGAQAREQAAQADAAAARAQAQVSDLRRDWLKARDRLASLEEQLSLDAESAAETESLAKLLYSSYQNGSSSLLEAQSASLKALEAKVRQAATRAQMLVELALISSLFE